MTSSSLFVLIIFTILSIVNGYKKGVPNCQVPWPKGHGKLRQSSSFDHQTPIPLTFKVRFHEIGGIYEIFIQGLNIKGYLVRSKTPGSWSENNEISGLTQIKNGQCACHTEKFASRDESFLTDLRILFQPEVVNDKPVFEVMVVETFKKYWHGIYLELARNGEDYVANIITE